MPEDSKKSQHKGKHDVKEQRKPRQQRPQAERSEKKVEKKPDEPKVTVPSKPEYVDPGPEFYSGLKRETDEILKITEEANSKYKKKEIQSNWTKYEMPIESYEEIEEQEHLGADYEKLSQAPLTAGGHFQFKHEKSWDIEIGPSLYDKYFEINMDNLATALSTIPFYERNCIDKEIFSETDAVSMDNRSVKYKRKYFNDNSFTTPDLEAQDNILSNIREGLRTTSQSEKNNDEKDRKECVSEDISKLKSIDSHSINNSPDAPFDGKITESKESKVSIENIKEQENTKIETPKVENSQASIKFAEVIHDIDDLILETTENAESVATNLIKTESEANKIKIATTVTSKINADPPKEAKPIIESPEDLEKWLDDFLDK